MGFSLWTMIEATILFVNALAILNEERFLKKVGWGYQPPNSMEQQTVKEKIVTLLNAVRMLMRIPLIFINTAVIVLEVLLG